MLAVVFRVADGTVSMCFHLRSKETDVISPLDNSAFLENAVQVLKMTVSMSIYEKLRLVLKRYIGKRRTAGLSIPFSLVFLNSHMEIIMSTLCIFNLLLPGVTI